MSLFSRHVNKRLIFPLMAREVIFNARPIAWNGDIGHGTNPRFEHAVWLHQFLARGRSNARMKL